MVFRTPRDTRTPWWSLPVLWWGAVRIILASASSSALNYWGSKIYEALASSSVTKIVNGDIEQVRIQRGTSADFSL